MFSRNLSENDSRHQVNDVLNTIVIGAKLGNDSTQFSDQSGVQINLKKIISDKYTYELENMRCVWWDHRTQYWSDKGCQLKNITGSKFRKSISCCSSSILISIFFLAKIRCVCNHATNFGVLVDIKGRYNSTVVRSLVFKFKLVSYFL